MPVEKKEGIKEGRKTVVQANNNFLFVHPPPSYFPPLFICALLLHVLRVYEGFFFFPNALDIEKRDRHIDIYRPTDKPTNQSTTRGYEDRSVCVKDVVCNITTTNEPMRGKRACLPASKLAGSQPSLSFSAGENNATTRKCTMYLCQPAIAN